jgi:chaperone required for assembly of F1-ATPase
MRDILSAAEPGPSDPDPMKRAQSNMRQPLPKRFYKTAEQAAGEGGFVVLLDGKAAKTPGRAPLVLPTEGLASLVAAEFAAQGETIDPSTMPLMRLSNTVVDGVRHQPDAVVEEILRYAASDLLCYRSEGPEGLVARQNEAWDPVLDWVRAETGARFMLAEGIVHVAQPPGTLTVLSAYLAGRSEPFRLAALHVMTTLTGSALLALAVEGGLLTAAEAWAAAHVDEDWNIAHWGEDAEAATRRALRWRDMQAAAATLDALDAQTIP